MAAAGPPARPRRGVELTFASWVPGMEKAVELWNEENPDIQVVEATPAGNAGTYRT